MSMIAPESYTAQLENAPYERLITARGELVSELESLEESFKNPQQSEWESFGPSPNVEYKMEMLHCLGQIDEGLKNIERKAPRWRTRSIRGSSTRYSGGR